MDRCREAIQETVGLYAKAVFSIKKKKNFYYLEKKMTECMYKIKDVA